MIQEQWKIRCTQDWTGFTSLAVSQREIRHVDVCLGGDASMLTQRTRSWITSCKALSGVAGISQVEQTGMKHLG